MDISKYIDHTCLKPDAGINDIKKLCEEAGTYGFKAVCVNGSYVKYAKDLLKNDDVLVAAVVGFPLGACTSCIKEAETLNAVKDGADEIDMVINTGALIEKKYNYVKDEIKKVVKAAKGRAIVKVIIETCLLNDKQKVRACLLAKEAGAHFVKTSTGFSKGGAKVSDIELMRKTVGADMGVKAAGGIRTKEQALKMIEAGADRIGCSASVSIVI